MKVIDLTHIISEGISVYPGSDQPKIQEIGSYSKDGYRETLLTLCSHAGTHVDAPNHIYETGKTLDAFDIDSFVGEAMVVDVRHLKADDEIKIRDLNVDVFNQVEFILFYRGADKKFGTDEFLEEYPVISQELIELINRDKKKGIGFDVIGLDKVDNAKLDRHKQLFKNNHIVNFENLNNLGLVYEAIGDRPFKFVALPLKVKNSDGAPVRAIAMLDD